MSRAVIAVAVTVSLFAAVFGTVKLMRYESTPGRPAEAPASWPGGSEVPLSKDRPTLVFLAHPRCTCTRASLEQLTEFLARHPRAVSVQVVLRGGPSISSSNEFEQALERCRRVPGARCVVDADGSMARRFGAYTSGQALLYATDGRLLFAGGLTAGRGVEAAGAGIRMIAAALASAGAGKPHEVAPVFGCELRNPSRETRGSMP